MLQDGGDSRAIHQQTTGEILPTFWPLPGAWEVPAVGGKGHELGMRILGDLPAALGQDLSQLNMAKDRPSLSRVMKPSGSKAHE